MLHVREDPSVIEFELATHDIDDTTVTVSSDDEVR